MSVTKARSSTRGAKVGDAVLLKQGWHILVDIGVPSGSHTYRPLKAGEWKVVDRIVERTPEVSRIANVAIPDPTNVRRAVEGEPTNIQGLDPEVDSILPSCLNAGEWSGRWWCLTHQEQFVNNISKDGHIDDDREHVLAWFCFDHGLEVP